ncbi:MAG: 2-oxoacid:ferredoxin oxidoreductase subunit gamma [Acidobacteria bacterium]|nr:MAG: 2-oxoacid:ferredoxin oxidoreductase subunit gamma [Acidobacteriota bacterium]
MLTETRVTTDTEVLMAGFGGQGTLLAGKVLAQASMEFGREVSWLPSYGPEMRGGTANVIVCIASTPIGSPLIESPRGLIVMNLPSMEKFAPKVRPGGVIVVNQSLIDRDPQRDDCTVVKVPSRELAQQAGSVRAANFVMLGAYVGATDVVPAEAIEQAIAEEFAGDKAKFIASSVAAFRAGLEVGRRASR